jgi:hypothetical protein
MHDLFHATRNRPQLTSELSRAVKGWPEGIPFLHRNNSPPKHRTGLMMWSYNPEIVFKALSEYPKCEASRTYMSETEDMHAEGTVESHERKSESKPKSLTLRMLV